MIVRTPMTPTKNSQALTSINVTTRSIKERKLPRYDIFMWTATFLFSFPF